MTYSIIATLGPASMAASLWQAMLDSGATAFRLNTSHMSPGELLAALKELQAFFRKLPLNPPVILDLQGSKWRLGTFEPFVLEQKQSIELLYSDSTQKKNVLPVPHSDFFKAAPESSREIVLNDGKSLLDVMQIRDNRVSATVRKGGKITPQKGITYSDSSYRHDSPNRKDLRIIEQTQPYDFVQYAISYIRDELEMELYQNAVRNSAPLIAKLERQSALDRADQISGSVDSLWLCRGDLGAELGLHDMSVAVHRFSNSIKHLSKPVVLAGQVLHHMCDHAQPTRSELNYLYDSLSKGYQGVVLSDETAIGKYPVKSCRFAALYRQKFTVW